MFNKYCTGGSSFNIKNRVLILECPILHCIYIRSQRLLKILMLLLLYQADIWPVFDFMYTLFRNLTHYSTAFQCGLFKNSAALNCPFLWKRGEKEQLSKCFVWLCTSATVLPKSANLGTFHFVVKHTLVSGTAANEPVTHTLTVSHHELLMSLSWLTVVKLKPKHACSSNTPTVSSNNVVQQSHTHTHTLSHTHPLPEVKIREEEQDAHLLHLHTHAHVWLRVSSLKLPWLRWPLFGERVQSEKLCANLWMVIMIIIQWALGSWGNKCH